MFGTSRVFWVPVPNRIRISIISVTFFVFQSAVCLWFVSGQYSCFRLGLTKIPPYIRIIYFAPCGAIRTRVPLAHTQCREVSSNHCHWFLHPCCEGLVAATGSFKMLCHFLGVTLGVISGRGPVVFQKTSQDVRSKESFMTAVRCN